MKTKSTKAQTPMRAPSGVSGLDEVLQGGYIATNAYLVRGGPGTGKTIFGLHFLAEGVKNGEKTLFISLGEPVEEIRKNTAMLGLDLKGINFLDLAPSADFFAKSQTYDIFSPAEVERDPITSKIIEETESLKPQRVFIDALTQFRYLSLDELQFRRQVLSFLRFMAGQGATLLVSSESTPAQPDDDLQFMTDGVVNLGFGAKERFIKISKFRGSDCRSGEHSMRLSEAGMEVFPRLVPGSYRREFKLETIASGVPELDELLSGGIERGTVTLITGPSGVGKTTLGMQFMKEAAGRGERSVIYTFEEDKEILLTRAENINIPVGAMTKRGTLEIVQVEPLRYTPDEFAKEVRREVEEQNSRIVMIDSTAGYKLVVKGEHLLSNLHALTQYLRNMGVTVIIINEVEYLTGDFRITDIGISYLADNVVFLRYLEMLGEMRKAIGVLKKRLSSFERTMREFEISRYGIKVGRPLMGLRNILSGTPDWVSGSGVESERER